MSKEPNYPECLRRPNFAGEVQTRRTSTEERYRTRYEGMIRNLCRSQRWRTADAYDLANSIGERSATYKASTLRQYHASIRQNLRDRWDAATIAFAEIKEIDALLCAQDPEATGSKTSQARTSAGRPKSMKPEQMAVVVSELLARPTPIREIAAAMIEHGVDLVTRPGEFLTFEEHDGAFYVRSGKFSQTNRRGLEPLRKVPTADYAAFEIRELRYVIDLVRAEVECGSTLSRIQRRCQSAIRTARKALKGQAKKITAYTSRHQGRANLAAAGMSPEEVAVIMGHASAGTAQSHYAPARRAWRGSNEMRPPAVDPALVDKVRPVHPSRGWANEHKAEGVKPHSPMGG